MARSPVDYNKLKCKIKSTNHEGTQKVKKLIQETIRPLSTAHSVGLCPYSVGAGRLKYFANLIAYGPIVRFNIHIRSHTAWQALEAIVCTVIAIPKLLAFRLEPDCHFDALPDLKRVAEHHETELIAEAIAAIFHVASGQVGVASPAVQRVADVYGLVKVEIPDAHAPGDGEADGISNSGRFKANLVGAQALNKAGQASGLELK